MNLAQRLRLMVLPLLLGVAFFAGVQIKDFVVARQALSAALVLTELSAVNSNLVHELQRERGATALFLGAKGAEFGDALRSQRQRTDDRMQALTHFLSEQGELSNKDAAQLLDEGKSRLQRLSNVRRGVDDLSSNARDVIAYYTDVNALLLQVAALILDSSPQPELTRMLAAYYNLLQGKERAGIERALLSNAFSSGQFAPGAFARFAGVAAEQRSYLETFRLMAGAEHGKTFLAATQEPVFAKIDTLRNEALNNNLQFDAKEWFSLATARIDLLKKVEDTFSHDVSTLTATLYDKASRDLWIWSGIAVLLLTASGYLAVRLSGGIKTQVAAICEVIERAATHNELRQQCPVLGQDELGQIANRLNEMLRRFGAAMGQLRDASTQLATSAEETASVSGNNAGNLDQLKDATIQVVTAVEEMAATIAEVARNTEGAAEATQLAESRTRDSQKAISNAVAYIRQAAEKASSSASSIHQLHDSSKTITSVLSVIRGIADQTNLLALNAAIEAARAGDQGRGFAVVADEVRTLAQRTQQSTVEIEKIVGDFERVSQSAHLQMEDGYSTITRSVEEMSNIQQVLDEVLAASSQISAITSQIAAAVHEQSVVSTDISRRLHAINEQTLSTATGGEQIASAAGEQTRLAVSLNTLAASFRT